MGFVKMFHFLIVSNKIKFNKLIQQNFKLFTQLIIQILRGPQLKAIHLRLWLRLTKGCRGHSVSVEYSLDNFHRSNQDTALVHKPSVFEGQWVQSGTY
jgi:hypothetical protein